VLYPALPPRYPINRPFFQPAEEPSDLMELFYGASTTTTTTTASECPPLPPACPPFALLVARLVCISAPGPKLAA